MQYCVYSKDVSDYPYFDGAKESGDSCPMYGDIDKQLHETVAIAEETIVQRLFQSTAELKEEDIRVDKKPTTGKGEPLGMQTPDITKRNLFQGPRSRPQ